MVGQGVAPCLVSNVQLGPLAVPVKGDAVRALVQLAQAAEVLVLDTAGAVDVEQAEGNLVLGIRLGQQVVEGSPVGEADLAGGFAIGDTEEKAILLTLDLALEACKLTVSSWFPAKDCVGTCMSHGEDCLCGRHTYVVLVGRRNGINKGLLGHVGLACLRVLVRMLVERGSVFGRELGMFLDTHERLFDSLLNCGCFRHGGCLLRSGKSLRVRDTRFQ